MKLRILFASAAVLALAGAAAAEPVSLYGNTLSVKFPDGKENRTYIDKDGTYTELRRDGVSTKGTWVMKDGKVCMTQTEPAGGPANFCIPDVTQKVGESWNATGPGGQTAVVSVQAGRP